jgi:excisionase family DNA binding protein
MKDFKFEPFDPKFWSLSFENARFLRRWRAILSGKSIKEAKLSHELAQELQCLTVQEAMELLSVSKATIYQIMNSGELTYITFYDGGDRRIVVDDLNAYLKKRRNKSGI